MRQKWDTKKLLMPQNIIKYEFFPALSYETIHVLLYFLKVEQKIHTHTHACTWAHYTYTHTVIYIYITLLFKLRRYKYAIFTGF